MSKIPSSRRGIRIAAAVGVCTVAALVVTVTPASASAGPARPAAIGFARTYTPAYVVDAVAGPFSSAVECYISRGTVAAAPNVVFVGDCVVNGAEWFFEYEYTKN
jgi:hypothetical protein